MSNTSLTSAQEDRSLSITTRSRVCAALGLVALGTSVGLVGTASGAAAAEPRYQHASSSYQHTQQGSLEGGYISCPTGTKAVATGASTGGAYGYLMAGLVTHDSNGGYHTAWGSNGNSLQLSARCVAPARLAGETLRTGGLRSDNHIRGREISCPAGTVPYGGGAFTTFQGQVSGGPMTIASTPSVNWSGSPVWRYVGAGGSSELVLSAHCLPRAKLGRLATVSESTVATTTYRPVSVTARCPSGYFAFTGGAHISADNGNSSPDYRGYLTTSTMAADDRGWTAVGYSFLPGTRVNATVTCTTRLG